MTLYNCRHSGDEYRITKFDNLGNVESSYLCTLSECQCPAGVRPTCRHRDMLPKFIQRGAVDTGWQLDWDRGGWVDMRTEDEVEPSTIEPVNYIYSEDDCPGHIASENDPMICAHCGVHIDSLRPDNDALSQVPAHALAMLPAPAKWRRF